jgi:zinc transport system ATP-binding protein
MIPVLKVENLKFKYGVDEILSDISFSIFQGDYVGVVGHNGSGKTTLIKNILGLLKPSSGKVYLWGKELKRFDSWGKIGYLPQNIGLFNPLFPATVEEIVSLGLLTTKRFPKRFFPEDKNAINIILKKIGISHLKNKLIGELSGGEVQKVFLAKALINNPQLLILDEPSNSLDPKSRQDFFSDLTSLNKDKKITIILITHDTGNISKYINKLIYLDKKLIFYGSLSKFCQSKDMSKKFGINSQHIICHQHN